MLNELENKIKKAIPELMELVVGCEFEIELANKLKRRCFIIDDSEISKITNDNIVWFFYKNSENESRCDFFYKGTIEELAKPIGKTIQLNHVLEYAIETDYFTKDKLLKIIELWDLTKNLLSDQSEELIKYLNELC